MKIFSHAENSHVPRLRKVDQALYVTFHYICFSNFEVVYQGECLFFNMGQTFIGF